MSESQENVLYQGEDLILEPRITHVSSQEELIYAVSALEDDLNQNIFTNKPIDADFIMPGDNTSLILDSDAPSYTVLLDKNSKFEIFDGNHYVLAHNSSLDITQHTGNVDIYVENLATLETALNIYDGTTTILVNEVDFDISAIGLADNLITINGLPSDINVFYPPETSGRLVFLDLNSGSSVEFNFLDYGPEVNPVELHSEELASETIEPSLTDQTLKQINAAELEDKSKEITPPNTEATRNSTTSDLEIGPDFINALQGTEDEGLIIPDEVMHQISTKIDPQLISAPFIEEGLNSEDGIFISDEIDLSDIENIIQDIGLADDYADTQFAKATENSREEINEEKIFEISSYDELDWQSAMEIVSEI